MKKHITILTLLLSVAISAVYAQSATSKHPANPSSSVQLTDTSLQKAVPIGEGKVVSAMVVTINAMSQDRRQKINDMAAWYNNSRRGGIMTTIGQDLTMSLTDLLVRELYYATTIRSRQKKEWLEMRQRECTFVDSMQSVGGQRDFYSQPSFMGPLDPTGINFDGITLNAYRNGQKVLHMVCHIDTSHLAFLFQHSRFYLVLDSLAFAPYNSFLPNLGVGVADISNREDLSQRDIDYWDAISHFDFAEYKNPSVRISIDLYSSWINELVQLFQDVKLGSFWIDVPVSENELHDSLYIYSRREALAAGKPTINMNGNSFVVPRSYMPLDADKPSWGTGEFKMKITLAESCRYNPQGVRAQAWHKDYKQLMRIYKQGKNPDAEYITHPLTTLRDNNCTLLKAVYTPLIKSAFATSSASAQKGAAAPAKP